MTKIKTTEIPRSARHLYIQLYCERKGGKNNENLQAATQSWLSLSAAKKQHFRDTISTKSAIVTAQRIIKTKPYLKEKNNLKRIKRKRNEKSQSDAATSNNCVTSANDDCMESDDDHSCIQFAENTGILSREISLELGEEQTQVEEELEIKPENENGTIQNLVESLVEEAQSALGDERNLHKTSSNQEDDDTSSIKESITNNAEYIPLPEPILPIVRKGRDLFELLKSRNGQSNKTYETLTEREKRFYGNAACAIKKDYVKKYKEYLESLPARKLYEHYMKVSVPE